MGNILCLAAAGYKSQCNRKHTLIKELIHTSINGCAWKQRIIPHFHSIAICMCAEFLTMCAIHIPGHLLLQFSSTCLKHGNETPKKRIKVFPVTYFLSASWILRNTKFAAEQVHAQNTIVRIVKVHVERSEWEQKNILLTFYTIIFTFKVQDKQSLMYSTSTRGMA